MRTLDTSDNNKVVPLAVATSFAVRLAENATAGYKWTLPAFDHGVLTLESDDTISPPADAPPGAGGARSFVFRVIAAGTTKIDLAYRRSWEDESTTTKRFTVTIVATG